METSKAIIESLSRARVVESMIRKITHHRNMTEDMKDLSQMIYMILLEYSEKEILRLNREGQLRFFIVRLILNQCRSQHSKFWGLFHKFQDRSIYMGIGDVGDGALLKMRMVYVPRILQ